MQCRGARELVSAHIDGEAAGENERDVAAHVASCPACTALANDYRRIGEQLAAGYEPAPDHLADKIRARLAAETAGTARVHGILTGGAGRGRRRCCCSLRDCHRS